MEGADIVGDWRRVIGAWANSVRGASFAIDAGLPLATLDSGLRATVKAGVALLK
jgi:hypothetical protein